MRNPNAFLLILKHPPPPDSKIDFRGFDFHIRGGSAHPGMSRIDGIIIS